MSGVFSEEVIKNGYTYDQFRDITKKMYEDGKPTSGEHSEKYPLLDFTKLNMQRMNRLDKTIELDPALVEELQQIPEEWYWVTFVEGWCGDVAQNLPIIAKMAESSPKIELRLLFRDQHPELIDQYLTEGGRSIPKLVCLRKSDLKELGTWGPRPRPVQKMVSDKKASKDPSKNHDEWVKEVHDVMHQWYADDQARSIQEEFLYSIKKWQKASVEKASV